MSDTPTWKRHVSTRCSADPHNEYGHDPCDDCYSIESFWRAIPYEKPSTTTLHPDSAALTELAKRVADYMETRTVPWGNVETMRAAVYETTRLLLTEAAGETLALARPMFS